MPVTLGKQFREALSSADSRLEQISEEISARPIRPAGWSSKEMLGHLIDSAINNHARFVGAALNGVYKGPTYQQNDWVDLHGYGDLSWATLIDHWRKQNQLLLRVVDRIPEDRLSAPCTIGEQAPVSLGFVIEDYLGHLEHHISQIEQANVRNNSAQPELLR
jgi:DinB family protein